MGELVVIHLTGDFAEVHVVQLLSVFGGKTRGAGFIRPVRRQTALRLSVGGDSVRTYMIGAVSSHAVRAHPVSAIGGDSVRTHMIGAVSSHTVSAHSICAIGGDSVRTYKIGAVSSHAIGAHSICTISSHAVRAHSICAISSDAVRAYPIGAVSGHCVRADMICAVRRNTICTHPICAVSGNAIGTYVVGTVSRNAADVGMGRTIFSNYWRIYMFAGIHCGKCESAACQNRESQAEDQFVSFHDSCSRSI